MFVLLTLTVYAVCEVIWLSEIPPIANALFFSAMVWHLKVWIRKFGEECLQNEIASILRQVNVFLFALAIEFVAVACLRLYRSELYKTCASAEEHWYGYRIYDATDCDFNSRKSFTLRVVSMTLDAVSKFIFCTYFLHV